MTLLDPADRRPVHFVGVAGAGMSALAELFVRRGTVVTGCDATGDPTGDLARLGIAVATGHDPSHVEGARAVVVSSALPKTHPELVRARELGLPVIRRAEALGEAVSGGDLVAIAGTHGKTTTTVMTTESLAASGREPTGVVGGRVGTWGGNLRYGSDRLFVVEADEYDRSFLALTPTVAVITNVEADHLDIYADLDDIRTTFEQFASPARAIVLCADDSVANKLATPSSAEVIRYGLHSPDARLLAVDVRMEGGGSLFEVEYDDEMLGEVELAVPGMHNVLNALAAIGSGLALGVSVEAMAPGLAAFRGVERRFQRLGVASGVEVVDDYAHHPTEIRATLAAARTAFPGRRIIAAFQPHLFSRTRDFAREFGEALAAADSVFIADIYPAREQPIPGVTAQLIVDSARQAGGDVAWQGARTALSGELARAVRGGDVVLTIGAGDITKTGPELLRALGGGA
ncbi:MAG TPA: UDP-N-acetylmuramate--L-alanine ligase [Gemmatimonadaceae bacterium]|jgi:UDP-N-acetylmuramate--alanine ligase|nr:UDP-N-acetylmuramate--L-alanine ligase [Gemmatimonadaceae bacterium]